MIKRLKNSLMHRFGKISPEELTVMACLERGMKVGKHCHGLSACTIDYAHCWLIEIGNHVTFAPQVYLLAHDASTKRYLDYTKIAKITIEDFAFVGARSLIMPGVRIGRNAIIAAGSVVTKDVPEGAIVGGNPAKIIGNTNSYIEKHKEKMSNSPLYDKSWTIHGNISNEMATQMALDLENKIGYVP